MDGSQVYNSLIERRGLICMNESVHANFGDAEFIAHAREDIPWLLAALARLQAERDEQDKQIAILKLSVPLEVELSAKIDEMLKYLAMEQGFTLSGIARLFIECQRRMAADWSDVGNERRRRIAAEAARDDWKHEWDLASDAVKALNDARLSAEAARDEALNVIEEQREQIATLEAELKGRTRDEP